MQATIQEGYTFFCVCEDKSYNIQYTNSVSLDEIVTEFREFLLASGFSDKAVEEYIENY